MPPATVRVSSASRSEKEAVSTCSPANEEEADCGIFSFLEKVKCDTRSVVEDVDSDTCSVVKVLECVSPSVIKEVDSDTCSVAKVLTRPQVRKWKRAAARAARYAGNIFAKV